MLLAIQSLSQLLKYLTYCSPKEIIDNKWMSYVPIKFIYKNYLWARFGSQIIVCYSLIQRKILSLCLIPNPEVFIDFQFLHGGKRTVMSKDKDKWKPGKCVCCICLSQKGLSFARIQNFCKFGIDQNFKKDNWGEKKHRHENIWLLSWNRTVE